jgi:methionyl-tRNA formyltransferase
MEKSAMKIVFMGTPDFATGALKKLISQDFNICAVITAPDKPAGRGQQLHESSVKQFASEHNIRILQPINLKDEIFLNELKLIGADLFVVVAFRMLPESVWSMPKLGTINLHASLLPFYRGAAPINWAIINGEVKTGVTTFFIEKEIDTGKIIEQASVVITEEMNAGELHNELLTVGAELLCSTINKIRTNKAEAHPQILNAEKPLKSAPKIYKENCRVLFNDTASQTHNLIRGLSPYPTAWTKIVLPDGTCKQFKLFRSKLTKRPVKDITSIHHDSEGVLVPCSDYFILITELQPEGKRKMTFKEFIAGNSLEGGQIDID